MKHNILFAMLVCIFTVGAMTAPAVKVNAQLTQTFSRSITTADTATFYAVPGKIKSFTYGLTKASGTVAGKVYLEGGVIPGQWVKIDSLILADVSTLQYKTTPITATTYLNYRFRCTNDSSATATIRATYLRRTDE